MRAQMLQILRVIVNNHIGRGPARLARGLGRKDALDGFGRQLVALHDALGAWFGWQALVPMILAASVIGAIVGIAMKLRSQLREGGYIPFGPFLAGAGFAALLFGPQRMLERFLGVLGL